MRRHVQADVAIERQCSATAVGYSGRIRSFGNADGVKLGQFGYRFALSSAGEVIFLQTRARLSRGDTVSRPALYRIREQGVGAESFYERRASF
jgi:hypothetical protein